MTAVAGRLGWLGLAALLFCGTGTQPRAQDVQAAPNAGSSLAAFAGSWTTTPNGACTGQLYTWQVTGDELRFRSAAGHVDVERVIDRQPNGFTAATISSPTHPAGTRWDFRILSPDQLRVTNLSTRRSFAMTRCGASAAPAQVPMPVQATLPQGRWGYIPPSESEGAKLFWAQPGDTHGRIFLTCAQDGRTFSLTLAGPELPIGQRVRVSVSAGLTTSMVDVTVGEGPVSNVAAILPSSHPLLAMLRGGSDRLRVRGVGAGPSYDLPLTGAADPVRRFEASCRPR